MPLNSMTGFSRASGQFQGQTFAWEIKSVNGKALDLRLRLPAGLDHLEVPARQALVAAFKRGNLQINLAMAESSKAGKLTINQDLLQQYVNLANSLQKQVGGAALSPEALLSMKGVVEIVAPQSAEDDQVKRDVSILAALQEAIVGLATARREEGKNISKIISAHLHQITALHQRANSLASRKPEAIKARLKEQVKALLEAGMPDEQRLAQEAAILFTKADIQEELDRLELHIAAAQALLKDKDAVGRKFDFLAQEFNREANTLCSKSNDSGLTTIGLDLKTTIDQMREQVQNIE